MHSLSANGGDAGAFGKILDAIAKSDSELARRKEHGWSGVIADCRRLAQETADRVTELTGLEPLSAPEFCAPQMVAMPVPDTDPTKLHDDLLDRYGIEIPVFKWQDRTIVRLSVQGYNSRTQMDLLIEALRVLQAPGIKPA